jgi:hypothetical protein
MQIMIIPTIGRVNDLRTWQRSNLLRNWAMTSRVPGKVTPVSSR